MDSIYKIIIIVSIFVIILITIEKLITKNLYQQRYKLQKNDYMKIKLPDIPMPCYVYRSKKCKCKDKMTAEIQDLYEKHIIPIHLSDTIHKQVDSTKNSVKSIFTGATPINSIIRSVSSGIGLLSTADPTHESIDNQIWKIYVPKGYNVNCFIEEGYLYIM